MTLDINFYLSFNFADKPRGEGKFGVVNLDFDQRWEDGTYRKSRPSRNGSPIYTEGLPATSRFIVSGNSEYVLLKEDLQRWMHDLCKARVPSIGEQEAKDSWKSLMDGGRYITDFAGSDTNADYINGTHLDVEPMKLKPMVTGGALLKIIGERRLGGYDCYVVEAINPTGNYRQYSPATHPHLFFQPTISRREQIVTRWHALIEYLSIPFPQYRDNVILPVFAMAGMNENYIPKFRVRVLGEYEPTPSPYRR